MRVKILTTDLIQKVNSLDLSKDKKWVFFDNAELPEERSSSQNRSLHLWLTQIANECNEKGIGFVQLVKDPAEIDCTVENLKTLWKRLQNYLFGTTSEISAGKTLNKFKRRHNHSTSCRPFSLYHYSSLNQLIITLFLDNTFSFV